MIATRSKYGLRRRRVLSLFLAERRRERPFRGPFFPVVPGPGAEPRVSVDSTVITVDTTIVTSDAS